MIQSPLVMSLTLALTLASHTLHNECITVGADGRPETFPPPPPKPLAITGRVCGVFTVHDMDAHDIDDIIRSGPISLTDEAGAIVATATADANGAFSFPDVAPGRYRITWQPGFARTDAIELTAPAGATCAQPLRIAFRLSTECDWYSHLGYQRPGA